MIGKQKDSEIFDNINSAKVNSFLRNIDPKNVPGLTAKVFRTYLATKIVKDALESPPVKWVKIHLNSKNLYRKNRKFKRSYRM
jgi:DNA topoisomerase-1